MKKIAGMRDSLIHAYDRVRLGDVWTVATEDVPELVPLLERLTPRGP